MVSSPVATSSSAGEYWGNEALLLILFRLRRFPLPHLLSIPTAF